MMNSRRTLLVALLLASTALPATAATYRIDPKDTTANFEVKFLGLLPIRGEFRRTTGTLVYDIATKQGSIEVFIDATTLEASTPTAQSSARGPEFFEVDKYPSIDFKSSRFVFDENRLKSVEGNLTMVGKTRQVALIINDSECVAAVEQEPARCRAVAELRVKRSTFGMTAWSHAVGEEVTIRIVLTARQVADGEPRKAEPPTDPKADSASERKPADVPSAPLPAAPKNGASPGGSATRGP